MAVSDDRRERRVTSETVEFRPKTGEHHATASDRAEGASRSLAETGALGAGAALTGAVTGSSTSEHLATTGPRMAVRFFGGWEFEANDARSRLPAEIGYKKGVPMGGDLTKGPKGKAPNFLVAALKDPYSGNLDRIQIVKGWLDANGNTHEKVYDVV